jgi:hypothetical protein
LVEACLEKAGLVYVLIAKRTTSNLWFAEGRVKIVLQLILSRGQIFVVNGLKDSPDVAEVESGGRPNATETPPKMTHWEHAARYGGIGNAACRFTSHEAVTTPYRQYAVAPDAKRGEKLVKSMKSGQTANFNPEGSAELSVC